MPWKKGQSGNPAGKKTGTIGQMLRETRKALLDHVRQAGTPHPLVALYQLGMDPTILPDIRVAALSKCLHYMAPEIKPLEPETEQGSSILGPIQGMNYRAAITPLAPRPVGHSATSGQDQGA